MLRGRNQAERLPCYCGNRNGQTCRCLKVAHNRKLDKAWESCRQQGIEFIPIAAWYPTAVEQIQKLGSALARQTVEEETTTTQQLFQRLSVSLMRGNAALFNNRSPSDAGGDILIKIQSVCQKLATLQHDFPPKVDDFWNFLKGQGALFSAVRRLH